MITYELAKKLKDAGFPNSQEWSRGNVIGKGICMILDDGDSFTFVPSLSELIEACGDKFESLVRIEADEIRKYPYWIAYPQDEAYKGDCVVDCCGYESGSTPEEAVANLWLELQNK